MKRLNGVINMDHTFKQQHHSQPVDKTNHEPERPQDGAVFPEKKISSFTNALELKRRTLAEKSIAEKVKQLGW